MRGSQRSKRFADVVCDLAGGRGGGGVEHVIMDAAAELGPHRPLTAGRSRESAGSPARAPGRVDEGDSAGGIGTEGVRPAGADEVDVGSCCGWRGRHDQPPIRTVGGTHHDRGTAAGHVTHARAAGLPPISTVGQPGGMIVVGG